MTKIYDESYEEKPIAEFYFNWKSMILSPATWIFGIATFGLYFLWIMFRTGKMSQQTYIIYPQYIKHIDKSSFTGQYNYQFEMIERVDVEYSLFDWMFGTGTIKLKTKGFKFWNNVYMEKISNVEKAVSLLNSAISRHKQNIGMR